MDSRIRIAPNVELADRPRIYQAVKQKEDFTVSHFKRFKHEQMDKG